MVNYILNLFTGILYLHSTSLKTCEYVTRPFSLHGRERETQRDTERRREREREQSTSINDSFSSDCKHVCEGFYNFSKVCLQFFSFLNVVFFRLFYDNITFQHLFIIIKCPAELNFDCKILIRSVPSTFVTELLLRGYVNL